VREQPGTSRAPATDSTVQGPRLLERIIGRDPGVQSVSIALLFGLGVLAIGLGQVGASREWGFTWGGALDGVPSQLAYTAAPAVLVAIATAANMLAGAIVLRFLGTPAYRSLSDLILAGFAAAVVLDAAALFLLGSLGLFGWPELLLLHLIALVAYAVTRESRPLTAFVPHLRARRPAAWWLLVVAIWAGPLIIQLASPAAPFIDVLPNHVAPVEHARVFGSFATLTTSPSPIYGPSRLMLGYVGLLGDLTTIANLEAILAVAAFALPLTILMAVSMRRLAMSLFGAGAGFWVLLTFPLTFTFMRLADTRGTVAAFPLAAFALATIARELRAGPRPAGEVASIGASAGTSSVASARGHVRPDLPLAAALGAAILVHPLVGIVTAAAAVGMLLLEPRRLGPRLIPALGAGGFIAVPQAATMLGFDAPSWTGFIWIAAAVSVAYGLARLVSSDRLKARLTAPFAARDSGPRATSPQLAPVLVAVAIAACLVVARQHISPPNDPGSEIWNFFPRLLLLTTIGLAIGLVGEGRGPARLGWIVLGCGIAAGLAAWAASGLVGFDTLTQQAIHYEVPKTIEYWLPVMLALGAADGISAVMRIRSLGVLTSLALAAFLFVAIYPYPGPFISNIQIGEHRGSESLGLAVREAELGYWSGYPDSRFIVDSSEQEVIDQLRGEANAGRLGPSTRVLHLASSFQQWASVPIGVFVGALETSISLQPELSIHTEGGRLLGFDQLPAELASDYGYVVLEPDGLDAGLADKITAAGYHEIWSNSNATIYARN
jgi:hypothetical protein